ncbi:kelch motif protein (macronuclear) [Tetrahymena thermophila SB210]|uniref:Kelch motif protein n=1 Tax=Tetrahymena thermophila (strain SB210) TaxID=312017 RepID=Q24HM8_TETTS|nr:kelch motif protein [Tetrahymena thermophila SB210]EAS07283.2 kelch motif protein [Tetrahymena thermophila SB210]|eukprot:XP_001027525.2 kelch motif protein [Tetrahymena thermophila SB210]
MSQQKKKGTSVNESASSASKQKGTHSNENSAKKDRQIYSSEEQDIQKSSNVLQNNSDGQNQTNQESHLNTASNIVYIDPQVVYPSSEKNPIENINTPIFENSIWLNKTGQKKKASVYPTKRWGHTSVVYEKYLYVYGGCGKQQDCSKTMQIFRLDCETYEWNKVEYTTDVIPDSRDSHTANVINNKMWVFGGSNSELLFNEFWTFDLQKNEWLNPSSLIKGEIPSPREGHASAVLQDRYLVIIGGFNSEIEQIYQDVYVIDTKNKTSKNIGTIRMPVRESQSVCVIDDNIYLFGGQGYNEEYYNDLHRLKIENIKKNPSLNVEEIKTKSEFVPSKRSSHSAVAFQNRYIFIIGGEQGEQDPNNMLILNDIWVYDTRMNFWHEIKAKCQKGVQFRGRFGFSASCYKDKIIVYGGMQNQNILLEDIMVLHLRDDSKQFLVEERSQCSMCDSICGLTLNGHILKNDMLFDKRQRDLFFQQARQAHLPSQALSFHDIENSQNVIQNKNPQECWRYTEDSLIKLPYTNSQLAMKFKYLSIDFLKSLANMISSPFQAIALLFNFLFSLNDQVYIEFKDNTDSSLLLYQNKQGANSKDFLKYVYSFSHTRFLEYDRFNKDREPYMKENDRLITISEFSNQIKIAGCRLGEQIILQSRHLNTYSIGVINFSNKQSNEAVENVEQNMIESFYYSYDEQNKKFVSQDGEQMKAIIDKLVDKQYVDFHKEENDITQGFSIRIRNLSRISDLKSDYSSSNQQEKNEIVYQSSVNDLVLNTPSFIDPNEIKSLNQTIDYSFKQFAKYFYYNPNQTKELFLNDEKIEFQSYVSSLQTIPSLLKIENNDNQQYLEQIGDLQLFTQNPDNTNEDSNKALNGCLAYYDNKFVFRFGSETQVGFPSFLKIYNKYIDKKTIYNVHGTLVLQDFLKPNIVYNQIENQFLDEIFQTKIKKIIKDACSSLKRKGDDSINKFQPSIKKQPKLNEQK